MKNKKIWFTNILREITVVKILFTVSQETARWKFIHVGGRRHRFPNRSAYTNEFRLRGTKQPHTLYGLLRTVDHRRSYNFVTKRESKNKIRPIRSPTRIRRRRALPIPVR